MDIQAVRQRLDMMQMEYALRHDGTLVWPFASYYGVHPIIFQDEQGGYVEARINFPLPTLPRKEAFSKLLLDCIPPNKSVVVDLSGDGRQIVLRSYCSDKDGVGIVATNLGWLADQLRPVIVHVMEHGDWNPELVKFAFFPSEVYSGLH